MYKNNKVLCVIPARSGSKGLPGKNIKKLLGKPLIAYTIEHAKESKYIDRIIVSTDDLTIAAIAKRYGAEIPFLRPKALARDSAGTVDVLLHAMDLMEKKESFTFDILVLLHATTPLRTPDDIDNCIDLLVDKNADSVFSVTESHRNPYFNMIEIDKDKKVSLVKKGAFLTRQSCPQVFDMNSSIYVWRKEALKKKRGIFLKKSRIYVMPKERSIDIDDYFDFEIAKILMQKQIRERNTNRL